MVVIHYTAMPSCAEARARLCDPDAEVSAHWLISEVGKIDALVDENLRAWHAGAGQWGAVSDVNSRSIGIELANAGDVPFPEPQMAALERLLAAVQARCPATMLVSVGDRESDVYELFEEATKHPEGPKLLIPTWYARRLYSSEASLGTMIQFQISVRPGPRGCQVRTER